MKYIVQNLKTDMKLLRNGKMTVIKSGQKTAVSIQEYQYLAQVYGMNVKGEKEVSVRITEPVKIESFADVKNIEIKNTLKKNKRKGKKVSNR